MKLSIPCLISLLAGLTLAGCDKAAEKASEKLAEKAIESQMSKDGTKAKVDLSSGTAKVTTTDASGKTSTIEWGGAPVSEAELGVPFYPGTKPRDGGVSRMVTPQGIAFTVALQSSDPTDKVAAFYREKLKAQAQGKNFADISAGAGETTLMLTDGNNGSIHVHVAKAEAGSEVNIVVNRQGAK